AGSSHEEQASAGLSRWNGAAGMVDLAFHLWEGKAETRGQIEYSPDLFRPETIVRMAEHWKVVLEAMAANPQQRVSDVSLLTEGERGLVIAEWNRTAVAWEGPDNLAALFRQQVERTPQAEAVRDARVRLDYAELNRRANRIARRLQRQGVERESIV